MSSGAASSCAPRRRHRVHHVVDRRRIYLGGLSGQAVGAGGRGRGLQPYGPIRHLSV